MLGLGLSLTSVAVRGGGGSSPAWHPTDLTGLVALYDISDLTSLKVERTGASASTAASVNGVVGTVLDLSGNGRHLTAPSDAARPILRGSGGKYWLQFDGVDDIFAVSISQEMRTFCVGFRPDITYTSATAGDSVLGLPDTHGPALGLGNVTGLLTGEVIAIGCAGSNRSGSAEPPSLSGECRVVYRDVGASGRDGRLMLNGAELSMLTPVGTNRFNAVSFVGASRVGDSHFPGRIYAAAFYGPLISTSEAQDLTAWLAARSPG